MNETNLVQCPAATNELVAPQPSTLNAEHSGPRQSSVGDQPTFPRASSESPRAYSAFITFFQIGHSRSLQAVADKLGESINTIQRWSSKFSWNERIQNYNAGVLQQQAEAQAASQREEAAAWSARMAELRRQEWIAAQKLLSAVQCYLEGCGEEQLEKMTLSQVARALNISSTISRQAIGVEALEKKPEPALSPIQIQLTEALQRAYGIPNSVATTNSPTTSES